LFRWFRRRDGRYGPGANLSPPAGEAGRREAQCDETRCSEARCSEARCSEPAVEELGIIVPRDEKPFGVDRTDLVRLPARGIAGSEFSAKIEGPARLRRKAYITQMFDGEFPIGGADVELEFEMTGPGNVKIDVIVTYPNGPQPKVTTYRFEVAEPRDPGVQ
jgi:hypothetical protein